MANPEHVAAVKRRDLKAIQEYRLASGRLDLDEADFFECDLSGLPLYDSDFAGSNLKGTNLEGADLSSSRFYGSDLSYAKMFKARFEQAFLTNVNLAWAHMDQAVLKKCYLGATQFFGTSLSGADFTEALCGATIFANLDLSTVTGLESVRHFYPSAIGIDTLFRSRGQVSHVFLRQCGVPEIMIEYTQSLTLEGWPVLYYTCFISFAEADDAFSQRLHNDLQAKGVRCWRWKEDARWGRTLMRDVDQAIRLYDKLILICSRHSLTSEPVIREIERALQKEQREGKEVLFPIRIDNFVFEWDHELQPDVVRKHIGDFRNWTDPVAYQKALDRLIRDLRAESHAKPELPQPGS